VIFRGASGLWAVRGVTRGYFGDSPDLPVPGDYDGDGTSQFAIYDQSSGTWYIRPKTGETLVLPYGWSEADPVPADYDGDGLLDLAVYHAATSTWYIRGSRNGLSVTVQFGTSGHHPVPADYDGDGKADLALYDQPTGSWHIRRSRDGDWHPQFGWSEARAVPADYDGDGRTELAVYHPATSTWYISGQEPLAFGWNGPVPVPGDLMAMARLTLPFTMMWGRCCTYARKVGAWTSISLV